LVATQEKNLAKRLRAGPQPAHTVRADLDCSGAANGGDTPERMDAIVT